MCAIGGPALRCPGRVCSSLFDLASSDPMMPVQKEGRPRRGSDVMDRIRTAKFTIGQVVRHRLHPFRGVIFDVDPIFSNTQEWWESIPEDARPAKDQPFYHLLAENADSEYVAYVSEQNLVADDTGEPVRHPQVDELFAVAADGRYRARGSRLN